MKKLLLVAAAAMAMTGAGGMTAAHAQKVSTAYGDLGVNEVGYVVVGDGAASNPDPADGYIGVWTGGIDCGSQDGPYSGTPTPHGCNPSAP